MIGILVQLAVSWLIIWLFEKGDLRCLGLWPSAKRLKSFLLFFVVTASCSALGFLLKMLIAKQSWQLNPDANFSLILKGVWYVIKSVLFEELIFRGVLLYILIKKLGVLRAILISGIAFGIYHWFTYGVIGNPVAMIYTFFITGIMGLVFAFGYAKSFSLWIPIGIHLGWNLLQMVVFSSDTIGPQLFVEVSPKQQNGLTYFNFILIQFLPLIACFAINTWLLMRYKQVELTK